MAEALRLLVGVVAALALPLALHVAGGGAWMLLVETAGALVLTLAAHAALREGGCLVLGLGAVAAWTAPLGLALTPEPALLLPLAVALALPAALALALLGFLAGGEGGPWRAAALSLALGQAALLLLPTDLPWPGRPDVPGDVVPLLLAVAAAGAVRLWLGRTALAVGLRAAGADPRLGALLGLGTKGGFGRAAALLAAGLMAGLAGGIVSLQALPQEPGIARPDWGVLSLVAAGAVLIGGGSQGLACASLVPLLVLPRLAIDLAPGLPDLSLPVTAAGLVLGLFLARREDPPVLRVRP
ncbi:MAG: hypothetical protein KDG89_16455 [Geminicoccaceae bacterium]|nr:hypothetical protein [Geminicoccaceae bacterium]